MLATAWAVSATPSPCPLHAQPTPPAQLAPARQHPPTWMLATAWAVSATPSPCPLHAQPTAPAQLAPARQRPPTWMLATAWAVSSGGARSSASTARMCCAAGRGSRRRVALEACWCGAAERRGSRGGAACRGPPRPPAAPRARCARPSPAGRGQSGGGAAPAPPPCACGGRRGAGGRACRGVAGTLPAHEWARPAPLHHAPAGGGVGQAELGWRPAVGSLAAVLAGRSGTLPAERCSLQPPASQHSTRALPPAPLAPPLQAVQQPHKLTSAPSARRARCRPPPRPGCSA